MPFRNVAVIFVAMIASLLCYNRASHNRYASAVAEAIGQIDEFFVEPIDRRELFEGSMRGMVKELDQYSGFVDSKQYTEFMQDLDQEFGGVGIIVDVDPDTDRLMVLSPLAGTPAYKAGLRAGDLIMKIKDKDTEGLTANDAVGVIRGKPGTDVILTILPYGKEETKDVTLTRAIIPIESVMGDLRGPDSEWQFYLEQDPSIGYVRLTSFGENSARDLRNAFASIDGKVDAAILDLRGNAGGLLPAAVDICNMFINEGQIVSIKSRGGVIQDEYWADEETVIPTDLPMVVLIDHYSASASEIVSACFQDHNRAKVIGERSWGKGTVQSVFPLEGGRSALRLTTATYWRPSGRNIHRLAKSTEEDEWGVTPDDGFEIKLEREAYIEMLKARRNRDVPPIRSGQELPGKSDETSEEKADDASPPDSEQTADQSTETPDQEDESTESTDEESTSEEGTDAEEKPFKDPHIEKALEYLHELLERDGAVMRKAA
ncbi:MAG: S41 family peptidase [Planctomycetota bacterium]